MPYKFTNWKEICEEKTARIRKLEHENSELREHNDNLYRAWKRVMAENYALKKKYCEVEGMPLEVKKRIYKNITGEEYKG